MEEKSEDDQGSGWLQVKKKHRSNSKFSFQGWVGGLSNKQNSNIVINEPNHVTSNIDPISTIKDSSSLDSYNSNNTNNAPTEEKSDVNYLDKCVVSHNNNDLDIPQMDVFPKIKFGNLDDDVIKNTPISSIPPSIEQKEKEMIPKIEKNIKSHEFEEEQEQVKVVSSEDIDDKIVNEQFITQSDNIPQENLESSGSENLVTGQDPSFLQNIETGQDSSFLQNLETGQDSIGPGEIEGGESKERFRQRLWCFLFENLNRAVDELYLLCELECDIDQMKEAVVVLEEAASDFKELNCRVEDFEKVKKSSDKPTLTMKSEQRRPHALSWEVRRMTTSPHRAEILSSSLEAFKKIQQERVTMNNNNTSTKLGFNDSHNRPINRSNKQTSREQTTDSRKRNGPVNQKKNPDPAKNKEIEKTGQKKDNLKPIEQQKKPNFTSEKDKERRYSLKETNFKSMDAWKQKRNWEDILSSPYSSSSRFSYSPGMTRKSTERARILHDKLMSPEKKKKSGTDLKKEAEEKHARAMRIRNELENERLQKLQKSTKKLNRVNEWQAVRSTKLSEKMHAKHQKSETRHEQFLAQVAKRAGDESTKVNEVRFITSLNEENKKLMLLQKYQDSELRKAEKLKDIKSKQKEDMAREEAVLERKKLVELEKMQRLAETQRKKEEALLRREEERKASSLARELKAMDQIRRREILAKAQQEEAELLAQKLAERLRESDQRRKFYLEQIKERASMDFRDFKDFKDQSSPLLRRSSNKDDQQISNNNNGEGDVIVVRNLGLQQSLKKRIKKIRQKLMALKYELSEPENAGIGYRAAVGTARAKIGRWLQEIQRHRQARKEGAASIGLLTGDIIKFLEGKDPELHASRQAGFLDFIASALPASHTSKPEASKVTIYFLRLLRVILSLPTNRSYFLAQNLLPPMIPMLSSALENFIKITASSSNTNIIGGTKTLTENSETISEILDGFLSLVAAIVGNSSSDERQHQMQDGLIELVIAYQVIHRLRDLFALYDRPQVEGSPFPSSILLGIDLLVILTSGHRVKSSIDWDSCPFDTVGTETRDNLLNLNENCELLEDVPEDRPLDDLCKKDEKFMVENGNKIRHRQPVGYLLSAISETGLVCLPSLLTAVLLQANNRLSSEQGSYVLPSNFEQVATGVLKVLNNLALIDINFIQMMLARPDLKMEFFHLMSYLLSHCTSKWGTATDQTGLLLLESLLLLGYFAMFHPENQAVLRWGKSPTILHKVCDLPFVFFSDPELMPVLAGTLVAACFSSEQNKGVVQQELSIEMLISLLKSCKTGPPTLQSGPVEELTESTQSSTESRKVQGERSNRRVARVQSVKTGNNNNYYYYNNNNNNNNRSVKIRNQKDGGKSIRVCESGSESSSNLMLYSRFPASFIDRAELFFSTETPVYM